VSEVRGTLGPGSGDGDLVRGAFPPGSVTGAPKKRAMEIIHELETTPREVYTGAVGYRSPVAGLELNVAIRTFEFCGDRVWLGAGGGIVADSRDDDEYAECLIKAGPLIRAVGGTLAGEPGAGSEQLGGRGGEVAPLPVALGRADSGRAGAARAAAAPHAVRPLIVMVDNYDSFTYNLVHMLVGEGCRVEVVRNDEVTAAQVAELSPAGIVISPGPCGPADAGISVDVVRASGGTTPLLGVCLGHQAVAAAFGGTIVRAPQPVHGRSSAIVHDGRALFSGLPQRFEATRYHSLIVAEASLPASLRVTARTPDGLPMALRHATWPVEGTQFHPESVLTAHGATIMRNFVQAVGRWAVNPERHDLAPLPTGDLLRPGRHGSGPKPAAKMEVIWAGCGEKRGARPLPARRESSWSAWGSPGSTR
jgi:anthranilate synthase/aminodeoxychorismate synthase-like glutamine amidotransferase